jgi:hypothetical protein
VVNAGNLTTHNTTNSSSPGSPGSGPSVATAIDFFSIVLPSAGLATPLTGFILQKFGVRTAVTINAVRPALAPAAETD